MSSFKNIGVVESVGDDGKTRDVSLTIPGPCHDVNFHMQVRLDWPEVQLLHNVLTRALRDPSSQADMSNVTFDIPVLVRNPVAFECFEDMDEYEAMPQVLKAPDDHGDGWCFMPGDEYDPLACWISGVLEAAYCHGLDGVDVENALAAYLIDMPDENTSVCEGSGK